MKRRIKVLIHEAIADDDKVVNAWIGAEQSVGFSSRVLLKCDYRTSVLGYIVEVDLPPSTSDEAEFEVEELLDSKPVFEAERSLIEYVASYYEAGLFSVLNHLLPLNKTSKDRKSYFYRAVVPSPSYTLSTREYQIYAAIKEQKEVPADRFGHQKTVDKLLDLGYLLKISRDSADDVRYQEMLPPLLQPAEAEAVLTIDSGPDGVYLLRGEAAAARAEVALELAKHTLLKDQSVVVIEPIVDPYDPLVSLFKAEFKERLTILGGRDQLSGIQSEKTAVVIGDPAAVFAPVKDLGLLIVDREEDARYKRRIDPKYSAKKVALKRIEQGGKLLMLSSSFSIESWARAERGYYRKVELPRAKKKAFEIVDLRSEEELDEQSLLVTKKLRRRIEECLKRGEKALFYLNRRGYAPIYRCRFCGRDARCPNCGALLTYYKDEERLSCHRCGYRQDVGQYRCENCFEQKFQPLGYGTERLVEELKELFPAHKVSRLDRDIVTAGDYIDSLSSFAVGESEILVGTKMICTNSALPKVGMVVAADLDHLLEIPDYTIEKSTFDNLSNLLGQLLESSDDAYLCTYRPDEESILNLARQDFNLFYQHTLEKRRQEINPPFVYLIDLTLTGMSAATLKSTGDRLRELVGQELKNARVLIVGPSPVSRGHDAHRYQTRIVVKYKNRAEVEPLLDLLRAKRLPADVLLDIDIDPEGE